MHKKWLFLYHLIPKYLFSSANWDSTDPISLTTIFEVSINEFVDCANFAASINEFWDTDLLLIRAVGLIKLLWVLSIDIEFKLSMKFSVVIEFKLHCSKSWFATPEASVCIPLFTSVELVTWLQLGDMDTLLNVDLVKRLLDKAGLKAKDVRVIGFHGQTIHHRPDQGLTWQMANGSLLAEQTNIDVVCDFRRTSTSRIEHVYHEGE